MSDFINKIITVILAFTMLVVAPLLISYKSDNMLARRSIMNDVEVFIDKVQDNINLTEDDLNNLYINCNSHGLTVDVTVRRLIAAAIYDDSSDVAQTNYFAVDDMESLTNMNAGDIVQVTVKEVTMSTSRKATYAILGIDEGSLEFTMAGVVG